MLPGMPPIPRLSEPEVIYEEVFCICNRPFQGFMVTCSSCGELYHGVCVGMTPALAAKRDRFVCPRCGPSGGPRSTPKRARVASAGEVDLNASPISVDDVRSKVRTSFSEAFGESAESARTAAALETALNDTFPATEKNYRARARMLHTNLRDARNHALREKLLSGALSVEKAVKLSSEELAPPEVANDRKKRQQELMQAVVLPPVRVFVTLDLPLDRSRRPVVEFNFEFLKLRSEYRVELPQEAFEVVAAQPWDLHHHFMGSLENRPLCSSGTPHLIADGESEDAPSAASVRGDSLSSIEKISSFGTQEPPLKQSGEAEIPAEIEAEEELRLQRDESSDRAVVLASVPSVEVKVQQIAEPPIGLGNITTLLLPTPAETKASSLIWSGVVECPGLASFRAIATRSTASPFVASALFPLLAIDIMSQFEFLRITRSESRRQCVVARAASPPSLADSALRLYSVNGELPPGVRLPKALYLSGRSSFASLLKYAAALESSSSRGRTVCIINADSPSQEMHLHALISDLVKRDRGAACKVSEGSALREAFVLPMLASSPLPSLLGGPPPPGDHLLLVLVHTRSR